MAKASTIVDVKSRGLSDAEKIMKSTQGTTIKALNSGKAIFKAYVAGLVALDAALDRPDWRAKGNTEEPSYENNVAAMFETHVRGNLIRVD